MNSINELTNRLAKELYGKTVDEAAESGLCIQCGEFALENCYSEKGRREYKISGICEKCFDGITKERS